MGAAVTDVAVLGASGYAGGELVRLLAQHPGVQITHLASHGSAGRTLADVHPHLAGTPLAATELASVDDLEAVTAAAGFVFCALPNGSSGSIVPRLVEAGLRVVDLAGDFRLPAEAYPEWYGFEHPAPAWLERAVYGLPELFRDDLAGDATNGTPDTPEDEDAALML